MNESELQRLERQATNLRNSGQVDEAIEIYEQLATVYTMSGDTTKAAGMVQMIGVTNKVANRTEKSIERLEEAKDMYERAGDAVGAGRALRDIAITHAYTGDYEAALPILMQSIVQLRETTAADELATSEVKLGEVYLKMDDIVSASEWITRGWERLESSDQWFYKATAMLHRAELAFAEIEYGEAEQLCEDAITLIRSHIGAHDQARRLAQLYGLLALSKLARQESSAEEVDLTNYYLDQLDSDSRRYLTTRTNLKDLPASSATA